MMEFDNSQNGPITTTSDFLTKTYFRMFLGLLATAIVAGFTYYSGIADNLVLSGAYYAFAILELILVVAFSLGLNKFSANTVTALFFGYAILNGVTFSTIFYVFELQSIVYAFLGGAAIFGIMALIGKNTTADLTSFGTFLSVTLFVGLIVSLINLFVGNSIVDVILDWVFLVIFMGFTLYDMNKITHLGELGFMDDEKLYVYGAMELYLDFINLFLRVLYLFGKRKD